MKKQTILILGILLLSLTFISSQTIIQNGVSSEKLVKNWKHTSTGNESILWNVDYVWREGIKICAVNSDFSDVTISECDKYYENETCEKYKDVKYKYSSSIKLKDKDENIKLELDIPDDAVDGCLTFPLNPLQYLWYKIGEQSIILEAITGYNATFTNTTEEDGSTKLGAFAHLNVSDPSLVAYYPFDVLDGNGTWVAGNWSNGLSFDGVNDYVEVNDNDALDLNTTWTISAWIKRDYVSGAYERIIFKYKGSAGERSYGIYLDNTNKLSVIVSSDGTNNDFGLGQTIGDTNWHFISVVFDNGNVTFYDNITTATDTLTQKFTHKSTTPLKIGSNSETPIAQFFNGTIDEVRIFDYALNSTEINELYTSNTLSQINPTNITGTNNLVINGGFDNTSSWSKSASISIAGGVASFGGSGTEDLQQNNLMTSGDIYNVTFTITNYSSGTLSVGFGAVGNVASGLNANGTYSYLAYSVGSYLLFRGTNFVGSVDNVSLYKVGNQVGYWKLNEIEGLVARDSTKYHNDGDLQGYGDDTRYTYDYTNNSNDGTINGNLFYNSSAGYYGGAYEFDGVNDYILISNTGFNSSINNFTLGGWSWASNSNDDSWGGIRGFGTAYADGLVLIQDRLLAYNGSSIISMYYAPAPTNEVWNHIMVVHNVDEKNLTVYVNGVSAGSTVYTGILIDRDDEIYLGGGGNRWLTGSMDEIMVFNRSLSATEIGQIYNSTYSRFYPTGEMKFTGLNFGTNNTVNITLDNCQTLNGSYLQGKINEGTWTNFTDCSFTDYTFNNGDNFTARFLSTPYNFYSPLVIGNISLDDFDSQPPIFTYIPDNEVITYPEDFINVNFTAEDGSGIDNFSVNDSRFTINSTGYLNLTQTLGVGVYLLNISVNDTLGFTNYTTWSLTINQNTGNCNVLFNETSPIEYNNVFLVWSDCNSDFSLYRNGTGISNNSVQNLNVGVYNFSVQRTDYENYSNIYDEEEITIQDTTYPTLIIFSPLNTTYTSAIINLSAYAYDVSGIENYTYSLDGGTTTLFTPNITLIMSVIETYHELNICASDIYGLTTCELKRFFVGITEETISEIVQRTPKACPKGGIYCDCSIYGEC